MLTESAPPSIVTRHRVNLVIITMNLRRRPLPQPHGTTYPMFNVSSFHRGRFNLARRDHTPPRQLLVPLGGVRCIRSGFVRSCVRAVF